MENKVDKKTNIYYGYYARLFSNLIAYLAFFIIAIITLIASFKFSDVQITNYKESSNLNYWVYVHENEFYEQSYLEKGMLYIANLIDKIVIDFDYNFIIDSKEDLDLTYDVVADLLITDSTGDKLYYKKSYDLLEKQTKPINQNNKTNVNKQISIDYEFYNNLANKFKTAYGVDALSTLNVYMTVNKSSNKKSNFTIDNDSTMKVIIPLTQSSIDIKLDYMDINASNIIVKDRTFNFKSIFMLIVSIISFLISIFLLVLFVKKILLVFGKTNNFDKVVNKILKQYDLYIAEASTLVSFEGKEVIKIEKFSELLDIHDNLRQPIMYYLVNKQQKCYFYINYKNIVYLVVIKAADLEKKYDVESLKERKKLRFDFNSNINQRNNISTNNNDKNETKNNIELLTSKEEFINGDDIHVENKEESNNEDLI